MNSNKFLATSEQLSVMYDATFTKKEAVESGKAIVQSILDEGNIDKLDALSNLTRLMEVVSTAQSELKKHLPCEKIVKNGMEFNFVQGGDTLQYEEDEVYSQLKKDLKSREELLKTASKLDNEIYDSYGN
jgi:hypothetical protein